MGQNIELEVEVTHCAPHTGSEMVECQPKSMGQVSTAMKAVHFSDRIETVPLQLDLRLPKHKWYQVRYYCSIEYCSSS